MINILTLSDIHLFNRRNKTSDIVDNLISYVDDVFKKYKKIDMIILAGDVFDRQLNFGSEEVRIATRWIFHLLNLCEKNNCILRVLEGTPSHDWGQSSYFVELSKLHLSKVDVKWVNKVTIECIEALNLNLLYIPDEITDCTEKTAKLVEEVLSEKQLTQVDISVMHGQFNYQLPLLEGKNCHNENYYLSITKGPIFIGHVHKHLPHLRILPPGSFDRLSHGEEENKGGIVTTIENVESIDKFSYKFIPNKQAKQFKTINCLKIESLEETIELLDELSTKYKEDSYIRLLIKQKSIIDIHFSFLKNKYFNFNLDKKYNKVKEVIELSFAEVEEYKPIMITKDNLIEVYKNKISTLNVPETLFVKSLEHLQELVNNE